MNPSSVSRASDKVGWLTKETGDTALISDAAKKKAAA